MTKTQILLPEPLYQRMKTIAAARDWTVAELIRRGMESYVQSFPEVCGETQPWTMPILRGSGGHLLDSATIQPEADAIAHRFIEG